MTTKENKYSGRSAKKEMPILNVQWGRGKQNEKAKRKRVLVARLASLGGRAAA